MNIVFDLGGVIVDWNPQKIIEEVFIEPGTRALVRAEIFEHHDWDELDRGTLTRAEAIRRAAGRTGIAIGTIEELMDHIPLSLTVFPDTVDLLYRLKAQDHRLLYLSNMHVASFEYLERKYSFWEVFEGGVVSCRVNLIKPEPVIYRALIETYGLDVAATVFIDDTKVNLTAASKLGIQTIHFENPEQCEKQLQEIGRE